MAKISWLISKLGNNHSPAIGMPLTFVKSDVFGWNANERTVMYAPDAPHAPAFLLHELGHALLGHADYSDDIHLLAMERAAWDKALQLAPEYDVAITDELIEESLDTYRDWLHSRSLCPHCNATGVQTAPRHYQCLACHHAWRVNEARTCALRRYETKKRP